MSRKLLHVALATFVLMLVAACGGAPAVEEVSLDDPAGGDTPAAVSNDTEGSTDNSSVVEVQAPSQGRLESVRSRGKLICGGNANLAGFGFLSEDGSYSGFDIDFCKVIAVAVFGEADDSTLEIRPLTGAERPIVLQSNEIDVLVRNTTWTLSRDTEWAADFGPTIFYDGQGMMVRKASNASTLEDLAGGSICVQTGTTTELNLADVMKSRGIDYEPKVYPDAPTTRIAYDEGTCDGFTTDISGLISQKQDMSNPDEHMILPVVMSKEPLGPAYAQGDSNWGDIVNWSLFCTIAAEELGIDSTNVDDIMGTSEDPNVRRMLGTEGALGEGLGLDNEFCANIIREMGNYGEIYNRNLGPDTPYDVPRGVNSLWTEGGLLYAPPFR